jgi:hypothetical protein
MTTGESQVGHPDECSACSEIIGRLALAGTPNVVVREEGGLQ